MSDMGLFLGQFRPLSFINCSTSGLISFSSNSLELPVMIKSSANLTRLAFAFRLALLAFGYFSLSFASNPSRARLAITGEQIPLVAFLPLLA